MMDLQQGCCYEFCGSSKYDIKCGYFRFSDNNANKEKATGFCSYFVYENDGDAIEFEVPKTREGLVDGRFITKSDCPRIKGGQL